MRATLTLLTVCSFVALAAAEGDAEAAEEPKKYESPKPATASLFFENFDDASSFSDTWVPTKAADYDGEWGVSAGGSAEFAEDLALEMKDDAKKHGISASMQTAFTAVEGKDLVIQYEVRLEKSHSCGGLYIKLLSGTPELAAVDGDTPYTLMFGPDHCGGTNKVHLIMRHANPKSGDIEEKHAKAPPAAVTHDKKTHLYTIVVKSDNSFEFFIDQESKGTGSLMDDMNPPVNPAKLIDDPADKKPDDWEDTPKINDPDASKPDDWDEDAPKKIPDDAATMPAEWREDEPAEVADPDATMPADWDEDEDGDWEAPTVKNPACEAAGCGKWERPDIKNPAFKGKWAHPQIDNPDYIGEWKAKQIDNPNFFEDATPYMFGDFSAVGIELWTMTGGVFFDNMLITRDVDEAAAFAARTWAVKNAYEKAKDPSAKSGSNAILEAVNGALDKAAGVVTGLGVPQEHAKNSVYVALAIILATTTFLCCRGGDDDDFDYDNLSAPTDAPEEEAEEASKEDTKASEAKAAADEAKAAAESEKPKKSKGKKGKKKASD